MHSILSHSSWQINPTFDMIYSSFSSYLVVKPLTNCFDWLSVIQVAHGGVGDIHGESSKGSCCHLLEEQRNTKALDSTLQLILAKNHPFRQPSALFKCDVCVYFRLLPGPLKDAVDVWSWRKCYSMQEVNSALSKVQLVGYSQKVVRSSFQHSCLKQNTV